MDSGQRLLSIDTTGETYALALSQGGTLLAEVCAGQPRQHLVQLFPTLVLLCQQAGISLQQIDGVAVTTGPGSFTGVRTGLLVARTLGQILARPIYPLDSLQVIAAGAGNSARLVVGLDARKREVLWAEFRVVDGVPELLVEPRLGPLSDLLHVLNQPAELVGSVCQAYPDEIQGVEARALPREFWRPRGASLARLGWQAAQSGPGCHWSEVSPGYIRDADVQVHSG